MSIGVAGRMQRLQADAVQRQRPSFLDAQVDTRQSVVRRRPDPAADLALQFQRCRDVVGVDVRVERKDQRRSRTLDFAGNPAPCST